MTRVGSAPGAHHYAVGREKVREYATAVGETNPLHLDLDAALAAGYADLVAPPMFAVVYSAAAFAAAVHDPQLAIDFEMVVHGGQEFEWGPLVIAGDEIATELHLAETSERVGLKFYDFESTSHNQRDEQVCRGIWTLIVRSRE